jgi:hypothetical protein
MKAGERETIKEQVKAQHREINDSGRYLGTAGREGA